jgi:hypothetical protein
LHLFTYIKQMANLKDSPHFKVHNDYYTPKYAWENIQHLIPKDKVIWEGCMLNSTLSNSPQYLTELGKEVVYDLKMDCLECEPENWDMIITNIPFETKIKIDILRRFVKFNKPFIVIMNSMNIFTNYFKDIFEDNFKDLQIIHPKGKIHFDKLVGEEIVKTKNCSFYCVYVAYKCNIPNDKLHLC